mmetsp:Transcript_1476/g.2118  ORF Transcript_1476/g.2118 Transcript_1476/m.2118 type:complete len:434 (+) Transcript_1476:120-1421(+)|eukprot:CAMPEP_0196600210 /NCGR_PEP_ID=MMETSP1081-20130531/95267_1 /TAXON_ID=36882 /ORGANISM="Pyramimonas amylifera, Strain CCMP720" /LENGTH=433 /DNA_ID=CAMNT_0041926031 /DNA_START=119 /DNA_END=1420 /DNA_ORIENTATION=-
MVKFNCFTSPNAATQYKHKSEIGSPDKYRVEEPESPPTHVMKGSSHGIGREPTEEQQAAIVESLKRQLVQAEVMLTKIRELKSAVSPSSAATHTMMGMDNSPASPNMDARAREINKMAESEVADAKARAEKESQRVQRELEEEKQKATARMEEEQRIEAQRAAELKEKEARVASALADVERQKQEKLVKEETKTKLRTATSAPPDIYLPKIDQPHSPEQTLTRKGSDSLPVGTTSNSGGKRFGRATAREMIEQIRENDPALTKVDLSGNASFQVKADELCELVLEVMKTNTHVVELLLSGCDIRDGAKAIGEMLKFNQTLQILDLQSNNIKADGAIALAKGLAENRCLRMLNLSSQQQAFGEGVLTEFVAMFGTNVTLLKLTWRVDSRQSFALNKLVTRNNEINRCVKAGRAYTDKIPEGLLANPPTLVAYQL